MLLAVLMLLGVGVGVLVYSIAGPASRSVERDKVNAAALAQARDALIGYAAADNRPGSLPCPDINNNGSAESPIPIDCPGYVAGSGAYVGRLPWRTLGLPDLRDGSGERLWYAVSREFARNFASCGSCPLNSRSSGQLTISGGASEIIAIVFSAGAVVNAQVRDTGNENSAANYLEGGNENGAGTSIFFTSSTSPFNDKLLAITSDALFPVVEMRVAREARAALLRFYDYPGNAFFPYANAYSDNTYQCTENEYRGRIPRFLADVCKADPAQPDWNGADWPSWFFANNWHQVVFYAVASKCAKPSSPACSAAGGLLTVSGTPPPNSNVQSLLIMPGRALAGQAASCAAVTDCLEDSENTNGDNIFVKSAVTSTVNDRLVVVAP